MPFDVDVFSGPLSAVHTAITCIPVQQVSSLTDEHLLATQRRIGELTRELAACTAAIAGEISYRSRRELGMSGLAQTQGMRTPAELITKLTGVSAKDAGTLVQVGTIIHDTATPSSAEPAEPWMAPAGPAVAAGTLSVEQAKAIRNGIGKPLTMVDDDGTVSGITSAALTAEVSKLVARAADYSVDDLAVQARQARDDIDEAGIVTKEHRAQQERSLKEMKRDGMPSRWMLTPDFETDAFMKSVCDSVMGPRSGGPRFVSENDKQWAASVMDDPRTNDQYLHDAFFDLFRIGVRDSTDPVRNRIVGPKQPGVRVLTSATTAPQPTTATGDQARTRTGAGAGNRTDTSTGAGTRAGTGTGTRFTAANPTAEFGVPTGRGFIEGSDTPISPATVERLACGDGIRPVYLDTRGHPLDVGREERGYTEPQRTALGVKWGGCANCGLPPSQCEIHHIIEWANGGETSLADGVPLCRFCHLMLHNNGRTITRDGDRYWMTPPIAVDPEQTPRELIPNSPALRQYLTV